MSTFSAKFITSSLLATAGAVTVAALFLSAADKTPSARAQPTAQQPIGQPMQQVAEKRPHIDVVFALDTTSSMSGLIQGAKNKIWSLANEIASGQPQPIVRFGLVAYRDRGDAYITKNTPLTTDMDELYEHLMALNTGGGGDTREHVNQALYDSIHKMAWSQEQETLKLVFLVGDAAPHEDYDDGLTSASLAQTARDKGIVINTIRCGQASDTEIAWTKIASLAGGQFASIQQNGGTVAVRSPYDDKLEQLNQALAKTAIGYGSAGKRDKLRRKVANRVDMKAEVAASAASYSAKFADRGLGDGDLVAAVEGGAVDVASLPVNELPAELRDMDGAQKRSYVKRQAAERKRIQEKLAKVAKERDTWLKEKKKDAPKDSFDEEVMGSVRAQAAEIGVKY